jgi:TatA/E family protein of Tat protein translocase
MEIMVILVVALLVLVPKKLPEAGRQVGRAMAEFRRWSNDVQSEVRSAIDTEVEPDYGATVPAQPNPDPIADFTPPASPSRSNGSNGSNPRSPSQFPDGQSFS